MKNCGGCMTEKPESEFGVRSGRPCGIQSRCLQCSRKASADRRKAKPRDYHAIRETRLKSYYGIDSEAYDLMLQEQGGVCAICKQPPTGKWKGKYSTRLAVDHDHATGAVRGLLCGRCNGGLGNFSDNMETMHKAMLYLSVRQ